MKKVLLLAAISSTFVFCTVARSAPSRPSVAIIRPWIAPPPAGAPTAAGYGVIKNEGPVADTLLSASTPAAEKLELHTMSTAGGIMRMRPATGGVSIASGQALTLAPNGAYHFMFVRAKRPLKPGERIPATLTFAKAGPVRTVFVVRPAPTGPMTMR